MLIPSVLMLLMSLSPLSEAVNEGADPVALYQEWRSAPSEAQELTLSALEQVGTPYRYATADPNKGFDCSGLVLYAAATVGVDLPHNSGAQNRTLRTVDEPQVGDLVWYPGHVSIYIGQGLIVHAPQQGKTVEVRPLSSKNVTFSRIVEPLPDHGDAVGPPHSGAL